MQCVLCQVLNHSHSYGQCVSYRQESTSTIRERMREAVAQRLAERGPLFLLVDGLDHNDPCFHKELEHELLELQKLGVKTLVTSRHNCALTAFFDPQLCDFCNLEEPPENRILEVYWRCARGHTACPKCYSRLPSPKLCESEDHEWLVCYIPPRPAPTCSYFSKGLPATAFSCSST